MFRELARDLHEILAIAGVEGLVGPIVAVVVTRHPRRPILVHGQVETLHWHSLTRQILESGAVEVGAEALVPRGPVEALAVPRRSAAVVYGAVLMVGNSIEDDAVGVGQAVVVAFITR